ncbi:MAG TPA: HlyD family efflux transporter periplasmic adaptor subunit [Candidatus Acidoferrales bacterium]|nr:HlyD family efflux transporter periplasmic adaptor subunit [Candidatus Acidoferrales bacterium]
MDIARPEVKRQKRIRRTIYIAIAVVVIPLVTYALSKLKPAAPSVDSATVWTDTVKRGPMLREVRGLGTLVPETIRLIPAATDGQVQQRYLLPGTPVKANTVILDLSNPQLQQETLDAEFQMKGAEANLEQTKAQLQNQLMDKRNFAASISSQYRTAEMVKETKEQLGANGLAPELDVKTAQVQAEELAKQNDLAVKEVEIFQNSIAAQLAVQEASVNEKKAMYELKKSQLDELHIRPGIDGMLQELDVEIGQKVTMGTVLARVAQPTHLKAQLKIAETQAKDVTIGLKASVDTHNGVIAGHVTRIDPAVVNGTVTVDVGLEGELPQGARPDLSVEGTVEIERLADVLYVGRPVHGEANSTVGLFKVVDDGAAATRVQVQLGRTSVNTVEIVKGLQIGDKVILSDMSAWDNYDRVQLK